MSASQPGPSESSEKAVVPPHGPKPPAVPLPEPTSHATRHTVTVGGTELAYEATVATTLIETEKVKPAASVFHAAFVALPDGEQPDPSRPVTFLFNGGPGSATTFLLLGSVAPRRISTPGTGPVVGAPYDFVDNPQSLLPITDLVFIDAPGAGFSQVAEEAKPELWSVDGDVAGFVQFIRRWLSAHGRWNSPKYVLGESYGTTRGCALTLALLEAEVSLAGLVLVSSILDYGPHEGINDQGYVAFLPTYAAIAHYHGRAGRDVAAAEHVQRAREFATGPYRLALAAGSRLSVEETNAVAATYAELTGLSADYVVRSGLRVLDHRFRKELLRDEQRIVGRYDGRVAGYDLDAASDAETFVVDDAYLSPAYGSLVNAYLRDELGWQDPEERKSFAGFDWDSSEPGKGWVWKHKMPAGTKTFGGREATYPCVVPDLAAALVRHPRLKVLAANGYFDLATPFFQTELDLAHLGVPTALLANLARTYYRAGHMLYTSEDDLTKFVADLGRFYAAEPGGVQEIDELG